MGAAIEATLNDQSFRRAAGRIADEMRAAPPVAELLATLLAGCTGFRAIDDVL